MSRESFLRLGGTVLVLTNQVGITTQGLKSAVIMLGWKAVSFDCKTRTLGNMLVVQIYLGPKEGRV